MTRDERYIDMVDARLREYLEAPGIPEHLAKSMLYSVEAGGKRLRPRMLLAACELFSGDAEAALPFACALEMIHTFSLIHDDMPCMDNDDYRRGKLTNHKVFGESYALLAGDGLLCYAFEVMADAAEKTPGAVAAMRAIAHGAGVFGMTAGQVLDLDNENAPARDAETLVSIHERKTGGLLTAAVQAGAHIAQATPAQLAALTRYGHAYGLLFQITDDILDVEGDFSHMGKTLGKDAAQQKLTYVTLYGLEKAKEMARAAAAEANAALAPLGADADYFRALADAALSRNT